MMRVNKRAKEETIRHLDVFVERLKTTLDNCMTEMRDAKTAEDMMESKKEMPLALVNIPRGPYVCYFCAIHFDKCSEDAYPCPYGKVHGNCQKKRSDYGEIINSRNVLEVCLNNYHDPSQKYKR